MKNNCLTNSALFLTVVFVAISCSRNELSTIETNDEIVLAENDAVFEAVLEKIDDQILKEIMMLEKYDYKLPATKSLEVDPCDPTIEVKTPENSKFPKTVTLDFGEGCIDSLGNFRAGKIIVHITGPYWKKNTVRHAQLVDYIYNDLKIIGDRHSINTGQNDDGYYVFELKHSQMIWTTEGKFLSDRDWTRVRIYNRGDDLSTTADDEVWVTGSAKVVTTGKKVVKEITVPLYRPITCQHFQSGVITNFINGEQVSELDYGTYVPGECDNTATWTNGKVTKTITLKTGINYYKMKP